MKPVSTRQPRPSSMSQDVLLELKANQLYLSLGKRCGAAETTSSGWGRGDGGTTTMSADGPHRPLPAEDDVLMVGYHHHRGEALYKSNRSSHGSDTSSAYSGSDVMIHSSLEDPPDLTGLVESAVDSEEEDEELSESIESLTARDTVREVLDKPANERSECDIETLLDFMQHLPAFANMTQSVRRALCSIMVLAVVEKAGDIVMSDGEEMDTWTVIVNGTVEVIHKDGSYHELTLGDSFGVTGPGVALHEGTMRAKTDDCQFALVAQSDYVNIMNRGEEIIRRHEEDGRVVLLTEQRHPQGYLVIRGTPEHLIRQLLEDHGPSDENYVADFLLTYRTFLPSPRSVAHQLLAWLQDPELRDRAARVLLNWVSKHFATDFETDSEMMDLLERMEACLESNKMVHQLTLLNVNCANQARSRTVTLARSTRDDVLQFSILGGYERGFGIFVAKVARPSKADEVGLRRGDQILEVNGQSFERVSHARALEILRGTTHLCITVRANWQGFKEMLNTPENSPRPRKAPPAQVVPPEAGWPNRSASLVPTANTADTPPDKKGFMTIGHRRAKLKKALAKINLLSKSLNSESHLNSSDDSLYSAAGNGTGGQGNQLSHSQSNPDLTATAVPVADYPEHVLKVYKGVECKHLLVHRETTAHEVVMLSLREFSIADPSSDYSLCEVSAAPGGTLKQRRLPDHLASLAERIPLAGRYYLKNNASTEPLVPDDLAVELLRETQVHLLQLNSVELAAQLTLEDYTVFRQIEPTEYIDDLFELNSPYGTPMLARFEELVNKEMFWVVTEVCSEHNCSLRMKIIKQFIKVARQCKECHNFNSMFAILSGLGHGAVSRLRQTWEKLPSKYVKIFQDLQEIMDPSRNMCKYRNLLSSENSPTIPFYPVVKKDLTFIHLGNSSEIGGLVNFEKLRMISKEVRQLMKMCDAPYDLMNMLEVGGGLTSAMAALNSQAGAVHRRHRKKSLSQLHPKKMFEEAQMVRRVKAYLSNLKVIEDEDKLHALSWECEPVSSSGSSSNSGGGATMTAPLSGSVVPTAPSRRRHPSPTLSSASSTSTTSERRTTGPKFGTVSPQAVRKLLSLADTSRVRTTAPPRPPHLQSPAALRQRCHGRSHSDSKPLDAESSSVAGGLLRKSQTVSSDSLATDSGHGSSADNSSAGSSHSPSSMPRHRNTDAGPPYTTSIHVVPPSMYPDFSQELAERFQRRAPDYTVTFKVARPDHRLLHRTLDIHSFYNCDDDDEDEGKEAAV